MSCCGCQPVVRERSRSFRVCLTTQEVRRPRAGHVLAGQERVSRPRGRCRKRVPRCSVCRLAPVHRHCPPNRSCGDDTTGGFSCSTRMGEECRSGVRYRHVRIRVPSSQAVLILEITGGRPGHGRGAVVAGRRCRWGWRPGALSVRRPGAGRRRCSSPLGCPRCRRGRRGPGCSGCRTWRTELPRPQQPRWL